MSEIEAAADAISGGLVASAIDPAERVPGRDGHSHETHCLNCATPLLGRHCHACGQHAHVHRTLGAFFHDLAHGILHVDGKLWRTLGLLAWQPGRLTRRYIEGERAKFVSPIALFLFTVFLTFAAFNLGGGHLNLNAKVSVDEAIAKQEKENAELGRELARARAEKRSTEQLETDLREGTKDLALLQKMKEGGVTAATMQGTQNELEGGNPAWIRDVVTRVRDNPALYVYRFQSAAYKYSWLLIPISVPFLWLLFPFSRRFRMYDHTVFVTYSLSFMTLAVTAMIVAGMAGFGLVSAVAALYMPFHMYRQLKDGYQLSRAGAMVRTVLLSAFAAAAAALFLLAIAALSI